MREIYVLYFCGGWIGKFIVRSWLAFADLVQKVGDASISEPRLLFL